MSTPTNLNTLQKGYFVGRILVGVIHLTISIQLLQSIYTAYKYKRHVLVGGDDKRRRYCIWSVITISCSVFAGFVCLLLDNNFIISWDFENNRSSKALFTSGDGIGGFLWAISKFAFYFAFSSHLQYLSNDKIRKRLIYVITVFCSAFVLIAGVLFIIGDWMEFDVQYELLQIDGMRDLFIVSYQDNTPVRYCAYLLFLSCEIVFLFFMVVQYRVLTKRASSAAIQDEAIQGSLLLFFGGLISLIVWTCALLEMPIFYTLPWIDIIICDIVTFLLLVFAKDSYKMWCDVCHDGCRKCQGVGDKYGSIQSDQMMNQEPDSEAFL
eukprot:220947_1